MTLKLVYTRLTRTIEHEQRQLFFKYTVHFTQKASTKQIHSNEKFDHFLNGEWMLCKLYKVCIAQGPRGLQRIKYVNRRRTY